MKNQKTEQRYLKLLKHLSQRKRGVTDIRKVISFFGVSVAAQKSLSDKDLIVKDDKGVWKWTGKSPDMTMASDVLYAVNRSIRKTAIPRERTPKNQPTDEKYLNFLTYLYNRKRGFKSFHKVVVKFNMCNNILAVLKKLNLVEKQNGSYQWVGTSPDMSMAKQVLQNVNASITKYVGKKPSRTTKINFNNNASGYKFNKNSEDILDIPALKAEKDKLQGRINKINTLLEVVEAFHTEN